MINNARVPLRICLAVPYLAPYTKTNGIAWYNRWLAEGLARRGHRVTVLDVSLVQAERNAEPWERTVVLERLRAEFLPRSLSAAIFVRKFIYSNDHFDILETSNWPGVAAFLPARKIGAIIIRLVTPSSSANIMHLQNAVCNVLESVSVRRADATIASTAFIEQSLGALYGKDLTSSYRVPFGIPDVQIVKSSPPTGLFHFLSIGRAEHRKGSDVLLAALVDVFSKRKDFVVTLPGSYATFAKTTPALQLLWSTLTTQYLDRLSIIEDLSDEQKLRLLAASDYLLMTSRTESFGLPVIEAMRAGTAVISSAGGGLREVAGASSGNILYDDPESVRLLAGSICSAIDAGRAEATARGRTGRLIYEAVFNEDIFLDRTIDAYRNAIQRNALRER